MEIDPRLRSDNGSSGHSYPPPPRPPGPSTPLAPNSSRLPVPQQYEHQSIYPSPTSQSLGHAGAEDGTPDDTKRPRACEACRGLKVRCEFDLNNLEGPCKRCAKANRNCIVTVPSRKRQKKTDSRVAELEKKIDALTATLQASKSGPILGVHSTENGGDQNGFMGVGRPNPYEQVTNGGYGTGFESRPEIRRVPSEAEIKKSAAPPMVIAGQKRKHQGSVDILSTPVSSTSMGSAKGILGRTPSASYRYDGPPDSNQTIKVSPNHEYADVIDRGIISMEIAANMFNYYVTRMAPHMPAVIFPAGTTASEIRRSNSTLFLAILSVASGRDYPEIQKILIKEVMQVYADRVVCHGDKTIELIQALIVSTLWYWPPEHFEELKFYQLIHIAAVMAIDIGIGRKSKPKSRLVGHPRGIWRDHQWKRCPPPDPDTSEARRTWLACYFMCAATSMGLKRPNLVKWTSYMADCIDVLENSPGAAPSDKFFCQWIRSQRIAEEVGEQFSMDDPGATVSIADSKVQFALKGFERDLQHWSDQVPREVHSSTLKLTEHVVNLYMHEIAMHVDHNIEEFKPPFTDATLRGGRHGIDESAPLTAAHISALSTCLTSIDGIFESFLSMDVEIIRSLPVIIFVRTGYAVVVLIKMYFAASAPNSEFGKVIDKDHMKVEQYIDGLLEKFKAVAADEKSRTATKFLMVLVMLKTWFNRSKSGRMPLTFKGLGEGQTSGQASESETFHAPAGQIGRPSTQQPHLQHSQSKPEYSPANTPLQLLSEVATGGNSVQRPDSRNQFAPSSEWTNTSQPYNSSDSTFTNQMSSYGMGANGGAYANIDPSLSNMGGVPDFDFAMGEGFEQAMGMTLGDGGFANYFSDDFFLGAMMDSVQGPSFDSF